MTTNFAQVKMKRGDSVDDGWIEARGAVVGAKVDRKDGGELWEVVEAYTSILKTQEEVQADGQHYKTHRKGTDI